MRQIIFSWGGVPAFDNPEATPGPQQVFGQLTHRPRACPSPLRAARCCAKRRISISKNKKYMLASLGLLLLLAVAVALLKGPTVQAAPACSTCTVAVLDQNVPTVAGDAISSTVNVSPYSQVRVVVEPSGPATSCLAFVKGFPNPNTNGLSGTIDALPDLGGPCKFNKVYDVPGQSMIIIMSVVGSATFHVVIFGSP